MLHEAELGGDRHLVAAALDRTSDEFLAVEGPVDLGGVDVGDAELDGAVDGADRLGVVERSASGVGAGHGHGAKADAGDHEVTEVCVLHQTSLVSVCGGLHRVRAATDHTTSGPQCPGVPAVGVTSSDPHTGPCLRTVAA